MIGWPLRNTVVIVGIVMSLIGIITDNWKTAVVGNTIALFALLFV